MFNYMFKILLQKSLFKCAYSTFFKQNMDWKYTLLFLKDFLEIYFNVFVAFTHTFTVFIFDNSKNTNVLNF